MNFEKANTDGVGCSYIKDGEIVIEKYPKSISTILKRGVPFLSHMPHNDGWTIAHLRLASHGENKIENTHPFNIGNKFALCHNGVWSNYDIAKLAMKKWIKFKGETDSEVAGHFLDAIGPEDFLKTLSFAGVFLALHLETGFLDVVKVSGELKKVNLKAGAFVLASEFDTKEYIDVQEDVSAGWYRYDLQAKKIEEKIKQPSFSYSNYHYGYNSSSSNSSSVYFPENTSPKIHGQVTANQLLGYPYHETED
jgi:predicted glutamine amidotransferase